MLGADFQADLARYPKRAFIREQSFWAVLIYRLGRRLHLSSSRSFGRKAVSILYTVLFRLSETVTGISLPAHCNIGPGLRIWHFGGIFIHPDVVIGPHCTLRQGVTIGNKIEGGGVPHLGDHVDVGAYAQILGNIRIGDRVSIGAGAIVLTNVPDDCIAVGNPARVLPRRQIKD